MDEKRKLRQLQKTAERLGVNVEDFLAQDDEDIEIIQNDNNNSRRGGGNNNYDSRLNQFMTNGGRALNDASTLGYDNGLFQGNSNNNNNTMASVMGNTNRERLLQEQRVQETIRAQKQQNAAVGEEKIVGHEDAAEEE